MANVLHKPTTGPECGRDDVQREVDFRLVDQVVDYIVQNRRELFEIGAIDTVNSVILKHRVREAARQYQHRHDTPSPLTQHELDQRYYNFAEYLVLAELAIPTVRTDWEVGRVKKAEESLGIRSFQELECVLAERYAAPGDPRGPPSGKCLHLHKGSGDGTLPYVLRKCKLKRTDPDPSPDLLDADSVFKGTVHQKRRNEVWVEIGYGDRLYFSLEKLLLRFIRPECAEDPAVQHTMHVLSMILAKELKNRWFERKWDESSMIQHDQKKQGVRIDLNDIFKLLANPQQWVQDSHLFARGKHRESVEFEFDTTAKLRMESEQQLLRWAGTPQKRIDEHLYEIRTRELTEIRNAFQALQRLSKPHTSRSVRTKGFADHVVYLEKTAEICDPATSAEISLLCGLLKVPPPRRHDLEHLRDVRKQLVVAERAVVLERRSLRPPATQTTMPADKIGNALTAIMREFAFLQKLTNTGHSSAQELEERLRDCAARLGAVHDRSKHRADIHLLCSMISSYGSLQPFPQDDLGELLQKCITNVREEGRGHKQQLRSADTSFAVSGTLDPHIVLKDIFSDRFVHAVQHAEFYEKRDYRRMNKERKEMGTETYLDLNREGPEMNLHNFVQGMFNGLPEVFPPNTFSLITAVRSDSHESDEDFRNDIEKNISLLRNGGVLLVDGIRQSLTRIQRLDVVSKINGINNPDLNVEVVFDSATHEPKSLLIQRRFTGKRDKDPGFLTDADKKRIFRDDTYTKPLQDVLSRRPDIEIATDVRRNIIPRIRNRVGKTLMAEDEKRAGYDEIFFNTHDRIDEIANREITRMTASSKRAKLNRFNRRWFNGVRTALLKARRKAPPEKKPLFGLHLHDERQPEDPVGDANFYTTVTNVMRHFGADSHDPFIREEYERVLFGKTAEDLPLHIHPDPTLKRDPKHRRDLRSKKLLAMGCNTEWDNEPELKQGQIQALKARILAKVEALVMAKFGETDSRHQMTNAECILKYPDFAYALPRNGLPWEGINKRASLEQRKLPDNQLFTMPKLQERLVQKCGGLKELLFRWKENHDGCAPVHLVRFAECPTNVFLMEMLQEIFGEDTNKLVDPLSIAFSPDKEGKAGIKHSPILFPDFKERLARGGLFVIGGSWYDAHDDYGKFFKKHIGKPLVERVASGNGRAVALGICFGDETLADEVGEFLKLPLKTRAGALEFCPAGVHVLQRSHGLFEDCPPQFTLWETHSGHVEGWNQLPYTSEIQALARSQLTGNIIAYTALKNRLIGIQPHPEARVLEEDRPLEQQTLFRLMKDVRAKTWLGDHFQITPDQLERMCRHAAKRVQADAGPHILVNAMHCLARELV